jgi:hypothetical protein
MLPPVMSRLDVINGLSSDVEVAAIASSKHETFDNAWVDVALSVGDLRRHFSKAHSPTSGKKLINVIDFELSGHGFLGDQVAIPELVRECDLFVHRKSGSLKYVLLSDRGAVTPCHVDYSGTAAWLSCAVGRKKVILTRPSPHALSLYYESRRLSQEKNATEHVLFEHHLTDSGAEPEFMMCTVVPGQTLFIPPGWFHSVVTLDDSVFFAGNFWPKDTFSVPLSVYSHEQGIDSSLIEFEDIAWIAARQ